MYCNQFKNRFKKLEIAGNYEDISKCFMIKSEINLSISRVHVVQVML